MEHGSAALKIERLENRDALAITSVQVNSGILTVRADGGDDDIYIRLSGPSAFDSVEVFDGSTVVGGALAANLFGLDVDAGDGDNRIDLLDATLALKPLFPVSLTAGDGNDTIFGGADSDTIFAGGGDDFINAGPGDNQINAGAGDDSISSIAGNDRVTAGADDDLMQVDVFARGGFGHQFDGEDGFDVLQLSGDMGANGIGTVDFVNQSVIHTDGAANTSVTFSNLESVSDQVSEGAFLIADLGGVDQPADRVYAVGQLSVTTGLHVNITDADGAADNFDIDVDNKINTTITAGGGDDGFFINDDLTESLVVEGGGGGNLLFGPDESVDWTIDGPDFGAIDLLGGFRFLGFAQLVGGSADDAFTFEDPDQPALITGAIDGGEGFDRLNYVLLDEAVTVNLEKNTIPRTGAGANFEAVTGTDFDDVIIGNDKVNKLDGGAGNDLINGRGGHDVIFGDEGADSLFGELGHDVMDGATGDDLLEGGQGNDTLIGGDGNDRFRFGDAWGQDDVVELSGEAGFDVIDFSPARRGLVFQFGGRTPTMLPANNLEFDALAVELLIGGQGNDVFRFARGAEDSVGKPKIDGGPGLDVVELGLAATELGVQIKNEAFVSIEQYDRLPSLTVSDQDDDAPALTLDESISDLQAVREERRSRG